jgi:hypothetical protein
MDLFVSDVLDLPLGAVAPAEVVTADGALHVGRLLESTALRTNLAFCEAWRSVFGAFPTRLDFADFRSRLGPSALTECIVECSSIRALPRLRELTLQAGEVYAKALSVLGSDPAAVRRALRAKLADRVGASSSSSQSSRSLVEEYAESVLCPESLGVLAAFEAWARQDAASDPGQSPVGARSEPTTVAEYYERSAAAIDALGLLSRCPLSGHVLELAQTTQRHHLTCVEALRATVVRDGALWRADAGGALLVQAPGGACGELALPAGFRFRHVCAPPRAVASALLPGMYSRIAVVSPEAADAAAFRKVAGGHGEVLSACVNSPSDVLNSQSDGGPARRDLCVRTDGGLPAVDAYFLPTSAWFAKRSSAGRAPAWADALFDAMLSSHMSTRCPLAPPSVPSQPTPEGGVLLFQDFMARYVAIRRIADRVFECPPPSRDLLGEVVVIESRKNVWSVVSLLVTLDNLDARRWGVTVLCTAGNIEFMRSCVAPHVPAARFQLLPGVEDLTVEGYSALMKKPETWASFRAPRVLIVQDDGTIVRPGLERDADLMGADYVGAPWADVPANAPLRAELGVGRPMVGNGGLSLRRVDRMAAMCSAHASRAKRLFNFRMMLVPEDVFFAAALASDPASVPCTEAAAERFAMEQRMGGPATLGLHKPWAYLPCDALTEWYRAVLADAAARALN